LGAGGGVVVGGEFGEGAVVDDGGEDFVGAVGEGAGDGGGGGEGFGGTGGDAGDGLVAEGCDKGVGAVAGVVSEYLDVDFGAGGDGGVAVVGDADGNGELGGAAGDD